MPEQSLVVQRSLDPVVDLVVNGLTSEHSRRAYGKAITDFLDWRSIKGDPALNKALVQAYKRELQDRHLAPHTINLRMTAIRRLAAEAADNDLLPEHIAQSIDRVHGIKSAGVRSGNWLTLEQAQTLINTPDVKTVKGLRDRAILSVLIGAGLRRAEVVSFEFRHLVWRENRPIILDILGKGNRTRTVPLPLWADDAIHQWTVAARLEDGKIFRSINKSGVVTQKPLTETAIYGIITETSTLSGEKIAPHDLRRTYAKLARSGGASLEQIQICLGHASIQTTERYLGTTQNFIDAPGDHINLHL